MTFDEWSVVDDIRFEKFIFLREGETTCKQVNGYNISGFVFDASLRQMLLSLVAMVQLHKPKETMVDGFSGSEMKCGSTNSTRSM